MPYTGTGIPVEAPRLYPPVSGLLAQVPFLEGTFDPSERFFTGVTFNPESGAGLDFVDICATNALLDTWTGTGLRTLKPFALMLRDQCSTWGWTENDYVGRATRGLEAKRHWGVERELEKGELIPSNPSLAETFTTPTAPSATVVLGGGSRVTPIDALCLLDEAIANSATVIGRGLIHAPAFLVGQWAHAGMLRFELITDDRGVGRQDRILSPKGNLIVAGNGYEGRGPTGVVPASHAGLWAYATDWMAVVASRPQTFPSTLSEATDKAHNLVTYRQDQVFLVLWAGLLHAAVQADTTTLSESAGTTQAVASHAFDVPASSSWAAASNIPAGTLVGLAFSVLSGTADLTDADGTVISNLPAGYSGSWEAPFGGVLAPPVSIAADAGSRVVVTMSVKA